MMGTGEAEEKIGLSCNESALNNPLIDDYSLKGAKGLLVNITGGDDIKLFEVDQAVNKIRSEVDPEAELIFGAIKDESLSGKMRVSIVATALDGDGPETRSVVNMVHRINNRNHGYSESNFNTKLSISISLDYSRRNSFKIRWWNKKEQETINENKQEIKSDKFGFWNISW